MAWLKRHRWFVLGFLVSLLMSLTSVTVFKPSADLAAWLQRTALYVTTLRVLLISLLFTLAFPLVRWAVEKVTHDTATVRRIERGRWRLFGWYLVIELIFMLGHWG